MILAVLYDSDSSVSHGVRGSQASPAVIARTSAIANCYSGLNSPVPCVRRAAELVLARTPGSVTCESLACRKDGVSSAYRHTGRRPRSRGCRRDYYLNELSCGRTASRTLHCHTRSMRDRVWMRGELRSGHKTEGPTPLPTRHALMATELITGVIDHDEIRTSATTLFRVGTAVSSP